MSGETSQSMTLLARLRAVPMLRSDIANAGLCNEAAHEIERLRAALKDVDGILITLAHDSVIAEDARDIVRAALGYEQSASLEGK